MVLDDFNMGFKLKAIRSTHRKDVLCYSTVLKYGTLTRLGPQGYLSRMIPGWVRSYTTERGVGSNEVARTGMEWVVIPPASTNFGGL